MKEDIDFYVVLVQNQASVDKTTQITTPKRALKERARYSVRNTMYQRSAFTSLCTAGPGVLPSSFSLRETSPTYY